MRSPIQWWRDRWTPPYRVRAVVPPLWATTPTELHDVIGRAGNLTPAQQWRANGGRR